MRRQLGRPAEAPQSFGPRDPDTVPGAGDLVILSPGRGPAQPSADD